MRRNTEFLAELPGFFLREIFAHETVGTTQLWIAKGSHRIGKTMTGAFSGVAREAKIAPAPVSSVSYNNSVACSVAKENTRRRVKAIVVLGRIQEILINAVCDVNVRADDGE